MGEIELGYMSVERGEWSNGECYCEINEGEKCRPCRTQLDPEEIVIPKREVVVVYRYPFNGSYSHKHITTNPEGFTRREISEQIMQRYKQMYEEEDQDMGGPTGNIPGLMNRDTSTGRYGIWGHGIGDLCLHSLEQRGKVYQIGVDS